MFISSIQSQAHSGQQQCCVWEFSFLHSIPSACAWRFVLNTWCSPMTQNQPFMESCDLLQSLLLICFLPLLSFSLESFYYFFLGHRFTVALFLYLSLPLWSLISVPDGVICPFSIAQSRTLLFWLILSASQCSKNNENIFNNTLNSLTSPLHTHPLQLFELH